MNPPPKTKTKQKQKQNKTKNKQTLSHLSSDERLFFHCMDVVHRAFKHEFILDTLVHCMWQYVEPEAYNLEASNFPLYVWNQAGLY